MDRSSEKYTRPSAPTAVEWTARPSHRDGVPSIQSLPSWARYSAGASGRGTSYSVITTCAASPVGRGMGLSVYVGCAGPRTLVRNATISSLYSFIEASPRAFGFMGPPSESLDITETILLQPSESNLFCNAKCSSWQPLQLLAKIRFSRFSSGV